MLGAILTLGPSLQEPRHIKHRLTQATFRYALNLPNVDSVGELVAPLDAVGGGDDEGLADDGRATNVVVQVEDPWKTRTTFGRPLVTL